MHMLGRCLHGGRGWLQVRAWWPWLWPMCVHEELLVPGLSARHALVWLQGRAAGSSTVVQAGDRSQSQQHTGVQPLRTPFPPTALTTKDHAVVMSWAPTAWAKETSYPLPRSPRAATYPCTWHATPLDPGSQHHPVCPHPQVKSFLTKVSPQSLEEVTTSLNAQTHTQGCRDREIREPWHHQRNTIEVQ